MCASEDWVFILRYVLRLTIAVPLRYYRGKPRTMFRNGNTRQCTFLTGPLIRGRMLSPSENWTSGNLCKHTKIVRFMEKFCVSLNVSGADSIAAGAGSDAE
jgi:hypothetical protein